MTQKLYISRSQVQQRLDISASTFWRLLKADPTFPRGIQFSKGCRRYSVASIEAWEKARAEEKRGA